jgi:hypothetical protein
MEKEDIDQVLGITRCARCGHRLEGEIECPFCSLFPDPSRKGGLPQWVYITACFLTSPLSIYTILKSDRLNIFEKVLAFSGCFFWFIIFILWF